MRAALILFFGLTLSVLSACQDGQNTPAHDAKWVSLAGGCFNMGETRIYREEGPITQTCLKPFEIWSHEITNAEFAKFVKATKYKTRAERGWTADEPDGPGIDMAPSSPVFVSPETQPQALNWWKLIDGANWRAPFGPEGPAFKNTDPVIHLTRVDAAAYAKWAGGRLPTEAEWEYAARGGLDGQLLSWEDAEDKALQDQANTWEGIFPTVNSGEDGHVGLAPSGQFPPNGFGLYDMIGNAWEWTSTPYFPSHNPDKNAVKLRPDGFDPAQGEVPVGVIKGGSYLCNKSYCFRYRPAARQGQDLIFGTSHIGFRIVRN